MNRYKLSSDSTPTHSTCAHSWKTWSHSWDSNFLALRNNREHERFHDDVGAAAEVTGFV